MGVRFHFGTDGLNFGHVPALDAQTSLTIAMYVRRPAAMSGYDNILFHLGATSTEGFALLHNGANPADLAFAFRGLGDPSSFHSSNGIWPADATWYPTWLVYRGGELLPADCLGLWVGAVARAIDLQGTQPAPTTDTHDQPLLVGTNWDGAMAALAFFPGVAIMDSTLIAAHAAMTGPLPTLPSAALYLANLTHYAEWENSFNFTIGGLTASVTGSPSFTDHPYAVTPAPPFRRDRARGPYAQLLRR